MWRRADATIDGETGSDRRPHSSADQDGVRDTAGTGGWTIADPVTAPAKRSPVAPRIALVSRPRIMPGEAV
jgi:hypothetical protein